MARGRGKLTPQDIEYMKIFSSNLNNLLEKNNIKQVELSQATQIPKSTLTGYVKGTSLPIPGNVQKIADFFNIKKSELDMRFDTAPTISFPTTSKDTTLSQITSISATLADFRQRKVLDYATAQKREQDSKIREDNVTYLSDYIEAKREGFVAAGTGQYVLDDHKEMVTIPSSILPKKSYDLMLQVKGDSMLPTFKDGEFVFVKKSTDIHNGQFGVFRINNESYIKKVYIENERLKLVSLNPSYPDLFFDETDDIELVGVVVM